MIVLFTHLSSHYRVLQKYSQALENIMNSIYGKEIISGQDMRNEVLQRMKKYEEKSFLECFSIYLGTAQLLEFALKKILEEKFHVSPEELENCTLGQTRAKLEKHGARADYTELLKGVVKERNRAAHELLADHALISSLGVDLSERMQFKEINHYIFNLEQAVFLFDYIQHNDAWLVSA